MKAPMSEEAWARKQEQEQLERIRAEREARIKEQAAHEAAELRRKLKETHWMHCPKCGHEMKEQDLGGIKVDICTLCEGIYFDRGELEELLVSQKAAERGNFFKRLLKLGPEL